MKKLIVLASLVLLVAAACNKQTQYNQTPSPTPTPPATSDTQTYTNSTYGFAFDYPATLQFGTPNYANLQNKITQVQIAQSAYPNTNFGDAAFAVSTQSAKSLADCLKLSPPEGSDGFKTKVTINGTDWYMTKSNGAGAGNRYDATVYRTVKPTGGACIEIVEMIHTGAIGNYPAGSVTEVNSAAVQSRLDAMLQTFKFTN